MRLLPAGRRGLGRVTRSSLAAAAAAAVALTLVPPSPANAVPVRGHSGWSVLLCKFKDVSTAPRSAAYFSRFFGSAGAGESGLYDYFNNQSYGKVKVNATVRGWYTMPYTQADEAPKSRWQKIADCVSTARAAGYTVPAGHRIAVITNALQDSGAAGGRVLLDPGAWNDRFAAHEMGHSYGLDHSWSNDLTYQNAPWSAPGEYDDPWDEMSAQHVYGFETTSFGNGGVGLNGYHRDKLGWIPRNRIATFGAGGAASETFTLAPLQVPSASGRLLVRVPFDPADVFHYYTIEFQRKLGWSRGIPADTVLIHEVKDGRTTLLRQLGVEGKPPVQSLSANGTTINVNWTSGNAASVTVASNIADRCLQGYVWREARSTDHVCVTPATRSQTWSDNSVRFSRWVNGAFGPHTCISGFVWREAFPGDDVCVTPATRSQAAADNAQASARRNPARFVFGPNTCRSGFVWRDADQTDYVCVTPTTRTQAARDNSVRHSRWVNGAFGPHTCISGFVWREAWPGDDVCVTPTVRSQTRFDNSQVGARVLRPQG